MVEGWGDTRAVLSLLPEGWGCSWGWVIPLLEVPLSCVILMPEAQGYPWIV